MNDPIYNLEKCNVCGSIITEDGLAVDCAGECDREHVTVDNYQPLEFDRDGVLRELPELEPEWED